MEEEIWLMEEMLRQPPQLVLTPLRQAPTTDLANTMPEPREKPDIRVRDIREVKTRIHLTEAHEPYDPANPGFVRPDRPTSIKASVTNTGAKKVSHGPFKPRRMIRAVIKPPTASMLKLVNRPEKPSTSQAETPAELMEVANPGPLKQSSPQLAAKHRAKLEGLFGATPPRDRTSSPKRASTSTSKTSTHGTENNTITNPGPRERSPQLITAPSSRTAAWLNYDDVTWLKDYPDHFTEQPGDLFQSPKKIQAPLERLLASLTPLSEVKDERVARRCTFTAYDKTLRLFKVTRHKNFSTPKIKPLGKTVHQLLETLKKRG